MAPTEDEEEYTGPPAGYLPATCPYCENLPWRYCSNQFLHKKDARKYVAEHPELYLPKKYL